MLSQYDPKDVYWQAQCMFYLHEYHRAAYIIKLRGFEKTNILCHYLAVESLLEAKEYEEAIELLNSIDIDYLSSSIGMVDDVAQNMLAGLDDEDGEPTKSEVLASICLLKGKVLEAMDNRTLAMESYVQALHLSVHCTEALDALVQHEMLLSSEENELMSHLPFDSQCTTTDTKIISKLYQSKLKKYYETEKTVSIDEMQGICSISNLFSPFSKRRIIFKRQSGISPQSNQSWNARRKRNPTERVANSGGAVEMRAQNSLRRFNKAFCHRQISKKTC